MAGDLQPDHHLCPRQADAAYELAALLGQARKRVLAEHPILGNSTVPALCCLAQGLARMPLMLDRGAVTTPFQVCFPRCIGIPAIGPYRAAGVVRVQHLLEVTAVVHVGRAHVVAADEAPATVRAGVQLVAVERHPMLPGPTCLHILLRTLGIAPVLADVIALLDLRVLFARVALDRSADDAGVDDLTAAGNEPGTLQLLTDRRADVAHQILGLEPFAPHPDRLGVGHLAAVFQSEELLEAAPIQHLVLQRIVGEVVQLLQQQQLDHHLRRPSRTATALASTQGQLRVYGVSNPGKVDMP
ncbi:hypothetical protein NB710_004098 [Xanthomonas sacchari]|nr:hypothetical protein [Xanthomonas sacchari]